MAFKRAEVEVLLAQCHRRCCICHRFCGVKMETDHMTPRGEGGSDSIDNAIPVCFECHAEIHSYNDQHPRGRKFTAKELRKHKKQWLEICRKHPDVFVLASREVDVGPLQALIDELEFNQAVAKADNRGAMGCRFQQAQFLRAIHQGSVALLRDDIRGAVISAYQLMGSANAAVDLTFQQGDAIKMHAASADARRRIGEARPAIAAAKDLLLSFLGREA